MPENGSVSNLEKLVSEKFLLISVILVIVVNLISNLISEQTAILIGNFVYFPAAGGLLFVSLMMIKRFGTGGKHGMAWISLLGFAIMWFSAETTWTVQEIVLEIEPFPSTADVFYILGYPFLLMFLFSYLEPVKRAISKKTIIIASLISLSVLIPSLYFSVGHDLEVNGLEVVIAATYPISDAFIIVPALIGVNLFFRGQVNFMWSLVCIGIICIFVADTAFLFAQMDDSYYTGHPMEILFHLTYVLMAYGVYDQLRVFKTRNHDTPSKHWSE